jgi:hypothetical protein
MKRHESRLARLESIQEAITPAGFPGYVCGADEADLQAQLAALAERGIMGRFTGYAGAGPDDWDDAGEVVQ